MSKLLNMLKKPLITLMMLLTAQQTWAQESAAGSDSNTVYFYIVIAFVFITSLIVLRVAMVILKLLKFMVKDQAKRQAEARGEVLPEESSKGWWARFLTKANDAVPIEEEASIILDHNYDGIRELDNHLPPWWKGIFYVSIVFAIIYLGVYHVFDSMPLPAEEYEMAMSEAEEAALARQASMPASVIDENNVELMTDAASLAKGQQIFKNNCESCHRADGGGGIGPNLTDEYWLHGGGIHHVFATIKNGVPEKGMISWEPLLSPLQMQNVASYVISMGGSNPPDAKAPQGEIYEGGEEVETLENPTDSAGVAVDTLATVEASL